MTIINREKGGIMQAPAAPGITVSRDEVGYASADERIAMMNNAVKVFVYHIL